MAVAYSSLNYKDALAITNRLPVARKWPLVAGMDGTGKVIESSHPDWKAGDIGVQNGWGVGETHWGRPAQWAWLLGDWLVRLPEAFTPRQGVGTTGCTTMVCIPALQDHGVPPGAGGPRGHRPRRTVPAGQIFAKRALGGGDRRGGLTHARQCPHANTLRRRRCRLRAR